MGGIAEIKGTKFHYEISGEGHPLVFVQSN